MELRIEMEIDTCYLNTCYLNSDNELELNMVVRILRQSGGWFLGRINTTEYAMYPCHKVSMIVPLKPEDNEQFQKLYKIWMGII